MENTPAGHQKLLQDIERLLAEAPDEASRRDLERLRDSLNSPQMLKMAREQANAVPRASGNLVLEFHDPLLPSVVTAAGGVIAAAFCLYAVMLGFEQPTIAIGGNVLNLWIVAAFSGALSAAFTALSFQRTFTVRFDTEGMLSRTTGTRWQRLHTGAMNWKSIRSLNERVTDRVLEVRAASGETFEIPMRVVNYKVLREHLDNMVLLYGESGK